MRSIKWKHRLEYGIYRLVEKLFSFMSIETAYRVGEGIGLIAWMILPHYRRLVLKNLRIAFGEQYGFHQLKKLTRETFQTAGGNSLASIQCSTLAPEKILPHLELIGMEAIESTLAQGQGVILVMGHMGSWEILTRINAMKLKDYQCGGIYRQLNNPLMDRLVRKRRSAEKTRLFSKKESFLQSSAFLKNGGLLVIVSDQRAGGAGVLAPFFGRLSSCVPLPQLLAQRTNAATFSLAMMSQGAGHWKVIMTPLREQPLSSTHVMNAITQAMSLSPRDGFWFHNRWKIEPKHPLRFAYRRIDEGLKSLSLTLTTLKPQRVLLALPRELFLSDERAEEFLELLAAIDTLRTHHFTLLYEKNDAITHSLAEALQATNLLTYFPHLSSARLAELIENYDHSLPSPLEVFINLSSLPSEHYSQVAKQLHLPYFEKPAHLSILEFLIELGISVDDL